MFTGIIQCQGRLVSTSARGGEARFTIRPLLPLSDPGAGESIAVNGVCLTAETFGRGTFTAYASRETLDKTTLGSLCPGAAVNLEQALTLSTRLGGHLVSGHVDCTALVAQTEARESSLLIRLAFPPEYARYVVAKGSVALDGISLTINACGDDFLEVNVIPETQRATTAGLWKSGTAVNMETDLIGKYVERLMRAGLQPPAGANGPSSPGLSLEFLRENGF
jgi:riboflavin synthase